MLSFPIRLSPVILLLGDSLTQQGFGRNGGEGWASLLANSYSRRADVLNRGFSGYNSRHLASILPNVLSTNYKNKNVLFCTVFLGTNDAALPGERQHVPLDEYESHLNSIVSQVREKTRPDVPMLLLTPPPVDTTRWTRFNEQLERLPSYRHNEVVERYGDVVKRVASQQNDCFVVDVFDLMGATHLKTFAPYLSDGLHLSSSGNRLVYEGIMNVLSQQHSNLLPESVAMDCYSDAHSPTTTTTTTSRPSIVVLGDSFTQFGFDKIGWVSLLASSYSRRADVLHRGFQGYTTRDILSMLPHMLHGSGTRSNGALFVTLWLGGNDAIEDERHVPLDEFESNLRMIIVKLRESIMQPRTPQGQRLAQLPVIMITPPPVQDTIASDYLTSDTTRQYADRVLSVAIACNCDCVDLFEVFGDNWPQEELWMDDGIQFLNVRGNELVYRELMTLIQKEYPQLAPMADGNGKYGKLGVPLENKLWHELS